MAYISFVSGFFFYYLTESIDAFAENLITIFEDCREPSNPQTFFPVI